MKYSNECYNDLVHLIENDPNWEETLKRKPYSLKSIKRAFYNNNWVMLVYNLFESDLLNPIVRACRGTVVDVSNPKDVKVVCSPYLKFCNLGEFPEEDKKIDWDSVWISEKIDGILIKASKIDGKFYWFTNGSFDLSAPLMDYSLRYKEPETDGCETFYDLLVYAINKLGNCEIETVTRETEKTICTFGGWCDKFDNNTTLCMELVSPKNKIICDYPKTELWLHGVKGFAGCDLFRKFAYEVVKNINKDEIVFNIKTPKVFDLKHPSPEAIKAITDSFDGSEEEGVVVCDKNWHRAKIKSKSYLEHKFSRDFMCMSDKKIFGFILSDQIDDVICDGNKDKIDKVVSNIENFKKLYDEFAVKVNEEYNKLNDRAAFAKSDKFSKMLKPLAFAIIDGKSSDDFFNRRFRTGNKYDDLLKILEELKK